MNDFGRKLENLMKEKEKKVKGGAKWNFKPNLLDFGTLSSMFAKLYSDDNDWAKTFLASESFMAHLGSSLRDCLSKVCMKV